MSYNLPGIDAVGLRPYINLVVEPAPAAPVLAPGLPAGPRLGLSAGPRPGVPAAPVPVLKLPAGPPGSNAPAAIAAPVEERPFPSWPGNSKPIPADQQPLTIWSRTSNKDALKNYVQGEYDLLPGGVDVVGSRAWLLNSHPGAQEKGTPWLLVSLLGRNGWTNNRVIVDAFTRMSTQRVHKFAEAAVGSDQYGKLWKYADTHIRQTISKKGFNDLFINKGDAGIFGDDVEGEDLWRLRRPLDPPKPKSKKGKKGPRPRQDGDGVGPPGDPDN
ncbi:hypothetical protein BOTCAL_0386g00060 [Botryotinia calthae]|uniref:Uncharacterized protein n=1 Tax=Botryotinia calthae TaxID=38488 RepID=A0A4Y8CR88_9HELO|nr:hypothetical protein BOTCAL_0386g00060 [Botryotinia calthae]